MASLSRNLGSFRNLSLCNRLCKIYDIRTVTSNNSFSRCQIMGQLPAVYMLSRRDSSSLLAKNYPEFELFQSRHLGPRVKETQAMLEFIGYSGLQANRGLHEGV
uniref:Uncharacterized protein n=1 Tax=Octopus bimaculoides TaxID=37653 RepID=A0A0L8FTJ5_OCTBM